MKHLTFITSHHFGEYDKHRIQLHVHYGTDVTEDKNYFYAIIYKNKKM